MDSSILPVAIPTIQNELNVSESGLQWIINSYLLLIATFLLAGGKVSDFFGHKRIFCLGMALFGLGSFFATFSYELVGLIFSRIIQGAGGAFMIPASMAILVETFSEKERGKMIGFLVAIGSVFLCLGPFLGGGAVEYFSWRYIFALNIPLVAIGLCLGIKYIPSTEGVKEPFDVVGFFHFIFFFLLLTLGLMDVRVYGWGSVRVILLLTFSLILGVLFLISIKRKSFPFLDYRLFKNKYFRGGNFIIFCVQFMIMLNVYWVIYFQKHLGYTPFESGLLSLLYTIPVMFLAPISGHLSDYFGPKSAVYTGFIIKMVGYGWLAFHAFRLTTWILSVGLILLGSATAIIMTPVGNATVASVSSKRRGVATAIYGTVKNAASPLSVAVFGGLISFVTGQSFSREISKNPDLSSLQSIDFHQILSNKSQYLNLQASFSAQTIEMLKKTILLSAHHAFFWTNMFCMAISAMAFIFSKKFLFSNKKTNNY